MAIVSRTSRPVDVEFKCRGRTFYAHKVVVAARSEYLRRLCENNAQSNKPLIVEVDTFSPSTIDGMLDFIYDVNGRDEMPPSTEAAARDPLSKLLSLVHLYKAADHYVMADLKSLAIKQFAAMRQPEVVLSPDGFITVILAVYDATSRTNLTEMRNILLDMALANKTSLLTDNAFLFALWSQHDLQEFAVDFLVGVHSLYASELDRLINTALSSQNNLVKYFGQLEVSDRFTVKSPQAEHAIDLKACEAASEATACHAEERGVSQLKPNVWTRMFDIEQRKRVAAEAEVRATAAELAKLKEEQKKYDGADKALPDADAIKSLEAKHATALTALESEKADIQRRHAKECKSLQAKINHVTPELDSEKMKRKVAERDLTSWAQKYASSQKGRQADREAHTKEIKKLQDSHKDALEALRSQNAATARYDRSAPQTTRKQVTALRNAESERDQAVEELLQKQHEIVELKNLSEGRLATINQLKSLSGNRLAEIKRMKAKGM